MRDAGLAAKRANADRQHADALAKSNEGENLKLFFSGQGRWNTVFGPTFASAKEIKQRARDATFKTRGK
eukprot:6981001-Alexandrium_andersonii.AAC.1